MVFLTGIFGSFRLSLITLSHAPASPLSSSSFSDLVFGRNIYLGLLQNTLACLPRCCFHLTFTPLHGMVDGLNVDAWDMAPVLQTFL